jgi:hypothetical protein
MAIETEMLVKEVFPTYFKSTTSKKGGLGKMKVKILLIKL